MQDLGIAVLFRGRNLLRLAEGLSVTLKLSLISIALSIVLGIVLAW